MKFVLERASCLHCLLAYYYGSCDRSAECHNSDIFALQQIILDTYGALYFETLPKDFGNLEQLFLRRYSRPVSAYQFQSVFQEPAPHTFLFGGPWRHSR